MKLIIMGIAITLAVATAGAQNDKTVPSKEGTTNSESGKSDRIETVCEYKSEKQKLSDKRKLALIREGEGCRVEYTKNEETKIIGNQKRGTDFCEKLIDRITTKLKGDTERSFECN